MTTKTNHHFYMASFSTWVTTGKTYTFCDAMRLMNKEWYPYAIWYVPLPPEADYDINFYAPQVPDAHIVELVKKGKTVKEKV